ncbi:hypothetical protein Hanom_Chr05g00398641 [Helianthus anomalus]
MILRKRISKDSSLVCSLSTATRLGKSHMACLCFSTTTPLTNFMVFLRVLVGP